MAWIESHQELADHPKTRRLMRLLGLERYAAIGLVHVLWYWALDYADDGDLGDHTDEDVADGVRWERDAGELVVALTTAGFLNADRTIHDWDEFAGRYVAKRQANAERMRAARATEPPPSNGTRAAHVQRTTDVRAEDVQACAGATVPNSTSTVPNLVVATATTMPPTADTAAPSPEARKIIDLWRIRHGKPKPPKLNPSQLHVLEAAIPDLGMDRLEEAVEWSAQNAVPEFIKAIRGAYTKRQQDEHPSGGEGRGTHRQSSGPRNGTRGSGRSGRPPADVSEFDGYSLPSDDPRLAARAARPLAPGHNGAG